jgi:hypothetical protein
VGSSGVGAMILIKRWMHCFVLVALVVFSPLMWPIQPDFTFEIEELTRDSSATAADFKRICHEYPYAMVSLMAAAVVTTVFAIKIRAKTTKDIFPSLLVTGYEKINDTCDKVQDIVQNKCAGLSGRSTDFAHSCIDVLPLPGYIKSMIKAICGWMMSGVFNLLPFNKKFILASGAVWGVGAIFPFCNIGASGILLMGYLNGMRHENAAAHKKTHDVLKELQQEVADISAGVQDANQNIKIVHIQVIDGFQQVAEGTKELSAQAAENKQVLSGQIIDVSDKLDDLKKDFSVSIYRVHEKTEERLNQLENNISEKMTVMNEDMIVQLSDVDKKVGELLEKVDAIDHDQARKELACAVREINQKSEESKTELLYSIKAVEGEGRLTKQGIDQIQEHMHALKAQQKIDSDTMESMHQKTNTILDNVQRNGEDSLRMSNARFQEVLQHRYEQDKKIALLENMLKEILGGQHSADKSMEVLRQDLHNAAEGIMAGMQQMLNSAPSAARPILTLENRPMPLAFLPSTYAEMPYEQQMQESTRGMLWPGLPTAEERN